MSTELITLEHAATPKGYANGRVGRGRALHVAGQVGWDAHGQFVAKDLLGQFAQALLAQQAEVNRGGQCAERLVGADV